MSSFWFLRYSLKELETLEEGGIIREEVEDLLARHLMDVRECGRLRVISQGEIFSR